MRSPRVDQRATPTRALSGSRARTFFASARVTIENPAQAYRVILAYQKLMRMGNQILAKAEAMKDAE